MPIVNVLQDYMLNQNLTFFSTCQFTQIGSISQILNLKIWQNFEVKLQTAQKTLWRKWYSYHTGCHKKKLPIDKIDQYSRLNKPLKKLKPRHVLANLSKLAVLGSYKLFLSRKEKWISPGTMKITW